MHSGRLLGSYRLYWVSNIIAREKKWLLHVGLDFVSFSVYELQYWLIIIISYIVHQVMSEDGSAKVGKISKQWTGLIKEHFTDADNFGINFPMDLDVNIKATLLGACFLIVSTCIASCYCLIFVLFVSCSHRRKICTTFREMWIECYRNMFFFQRCHCIYILYIVYLSKKKHDSVVLCTYNVNVLRCKLYSLTVILLFLRCV